MESEANQQTSLSKKKNQKSLKSGGAKSHRYYSPVKPDEELIINQKAKSREPKTKSKVLTNSNSDGEQIHNTPPPTSDFKLGTPKNSRQELKPTRMVASPKADIKQQLYKSVQIQNTVPDEDEFDIEIDRMLKTRTMTIEEFDSKVLRRFQACSSAKKSKISKMRLALLEDYNRECKHTPEINSYSNNLKERVPQVDRIPYILEDQNGKLMKKKRQIENDRTKKAQEECTFTPKINNNKSMVALNHHSVVTKTAVGYDKTAAEDLIKWGEQRDKRLQSKKWTELIPNNEYTFKPQICNKSKQILKDSSTKSPRPAHQRLMEKNHNKKSSNNIHNKNPIPAPDETFKPKINPNSRKMAEKKRLKDKQEIMIKNIQESQTTDVLAPQVNDQFDMERKIQEIFDGAYTRSFVETNTNPNDMLDNDGTGDFIQEEICDVVVPARGIVLTNKKNDNSVMKSYRNERSPQSTGPPTRGEVNGQLLQVEYNDDLLDNMYNNSLLISPKNMLNPVAEETDHQTKKDTQKAGLAKSPKDGNQGKKTETLVQKSPKENVKDWEQTAGRSTEIVNENQRNGVFFEKDPKPQKTANREKLIKEVQTQRNKSRDNKNIDGMNPARHRSNSKRSGKRKHEHSRSSKKNESKGKSRSNSKKPLVLKQSSHKEPEVPPPRLQKQPNLDNEKRDRYTNTKKITFARKKDKLQNRGMSKDKTDNREVSQEKPRIPDNRFNGSCEKKFVPIEPTEISERKPHGGIFDHLGGNKKIGKLLSQALQAEIPSYSKKIVEDKTNKSGKTPEPEIVIEGNFETLGKPDTVTKHETKTHPPVRQNPKDKKPAKAHGKGVFVFVIKKISQPQKKIPQRKN